MNASLQRNVIILFVCVLVIYFWYGNKPNKIKTNGLTYNLEYLEKTLNSNSSNDELPMLIMLHGAGDTTENFLSWYEDFKIPVRLIVFQGPFDFGRGYTWSGANGTQDTVNVAKSIHASIDELTEKYPTKGKPIVFGFSRGAILAYYMSISSSQYSYVVPVSGYLDAQLTPEESEPYNESPEIIAFHGSADRVISINKDRHSIKRLQELNFKASLNEYSSDHLPNEAMQQAIKDQISTLLSNL